MAEAAYYGAAQNLSRKSLGEHLRDYYSDTDFVTVQNIDSKPLSYQFMDPKNEQFVQTAPYNGETYQLKPPMVETLQPGQTKLCPAFEADRMLESLIKQITSSKTAAGIQRKELEPWQSSDWSDPLTQKGIVDKAFLGKEDILGNFQNRAAVPVEAEVATDLELDPAPANSNVDSHESSRRSRNRQPESA